MLDGSTGTNSKFGFARLGGRNRRSCVETCAAVGFAASNAPIMSCAFCGDTPACTSCAPMSCALPATNVLKYCAASASTTSLGPMAGGPAGFAPTMGKGDRMQKFPTPAQFRRNEKPDDGTPSPRMSYGTAGRSVACGRSRKNEKLAGVENARLYVARMLCVSRGLKTTPTRGDQYVWSRTLWLSTRSAPTRSHLGVRLVVDCTYAPTSVTSSSSSFRPLIVFPVRG